MTTNTTNTTAVAAIDLGYGFTKFTAGKDSAGRIICKSFPSMAAPSRSKTLGAGFFKERDTINVIFNGMEYEVGQDVELAMGGWSTRELDLHYTTSDTYPRQKKPDGYTLGWKLLDAVSTPNLESFARCLTPVACVRIGSQVFQSA